jgi:hypothetical protein
VQTSLGKADNAPTVLSALNDVVISGPANNQVLSYDSSSGKWVSATVSSTTVSDATTSSKGIVQLAGDLGGAGTGAAAPIISDNAITNSKINSGAVTTSKLAAGAVTSNEIADGTITNTDISATAAIAKTKLASLSIVDADVSAISESKVTNLTTDLAAKAPNSRQIITSTGLTGGGDLSADRTLSVVTDSTVQKIEVAQAGTLQGTRKRLNFIAGSNASLSVADDGINNKVDITVNASTQTAPNATTSTPGLVQLAGDLGGVGSTATAPIIGTGVITSAKIADGTIVDVDVSASAAIAATKISGTALTASNNLSDVGLAKTARSNILAAVDPGWYLATDPQWGSVGNEIGAALQAIITAMPATGGVIYIPPGISWTVAAAVVLKSGVTIRGAGRKATRVIGAAGIFTWSANLSEVNIEHLALRTTGGHMFTPTGNFAITTTGIRHCDLVQSDVNSSLMYHVGSLDYDNVVVEDCDLTRFPSSTVPGWYVVNSGGAANENRFKQLWVRSNNSTSTPFFYIESTSTSAYAYDNHFEDITGEQNPGGLIDLRNALSCTIDNVVDWDANTSTGDLIRVGKSASAPTQRSRYITIRNVGRRASVGLGASIYDINFVPGEVARCLIEAPNHSSEPTSGLRINFSSADQVTIIGAPPSGNVWTGQPANTAAYFGSAAQFQIGAYIGTSLTSSGTGSPEGVVTGSIGDMFHRTDGGASTSLYVKESGTATNTGWVAYGAGVAPQTTATQAFTSSGTWTKPTVGVGAGTTVTIVCIGGGNGGGSGASLASGTIMSGGGGGAGGGMSVVTIPISTIAAATVAVGVGGGGAGGTAVTGANGNAGSLGGTSTFGTLLAAGGSGGNPVGGAGSTATSTGGAATIGLLGSGGTGGGGTTGAAGGIGASVGTTPGGGGGGGISVGLTAFAGGTGGKSWGGNGTGALATGGVVGGATPGVGFSQPASSGIPGGAGGGGAASTTGVGQDGAAGGIYGAGGGGGGASFNSSASGAGGVGAAGIVIVTTNY